MYEQNKLLKVKNENLNKEISEIKNKQNKISQNKDDLNVKINNLFNENNILK